MVWPQRSDCLRRKSDWGQREEAGQVSSRPEASLNKAEHGVSTRNGVLVLICHWLDWLSDWTELFWVAVKKNYFINYLYVLGCLIASDSLRPHGLLQPTRLLCPLDSPGKNTGVGYHFLLQGIFLTWLRDRTHVSCVSHIGRRILYH